MRLFFVYPEFTLRQGQVIASRNSVTEREENFK